MNNLDAIPILKGDIRGNLGSFCSGRGDYIQSIVDMNGNSIADIICRHTIIDSQSLNNS